MEKINKIYALIRLKKSDGFGGELEVKGLLVNQHILKEENQITTFFNGSTFIFLNKLFEYNPDLKIGDFVEITPYGEVEKNDDERKYCFVRTKEVKLIGFQVLEISEALINQNYLDLVRIFKNLKSRGIYIEDLTSFYITDSNFVYGPLKYNKVKDRIDAKIGKEVMFYRFNLAEMFEVDRDDTYYILSNPKESIGEIDCMHDSQLIEFLKSQLTSEKAEINTIEKTHQIIKKLNGGLLGLDGIRLNRASEILNQLKFNYEELNSIKGEFSILVDEIVQKHENILKEKALSDISLLLYEKNEKLLSMQAEVESEELALLRFSNQIIEKTIEIKRIEKNREDLILSIKLAATMSREIVDNSSLLRSHTQFVAKETFELIEQYTAPLFDDFQDFRECEDNFIKGVQVGKLELILQQIKSKKFVIGDNTKVIVEALNCIGDSVVFIQNAEVDWLKYELLKINGLSNALDFALADPSINVFFILSDFNIASFECYGKPIIDIANGIRRNIPGESSKWPENFYLILIQCDDEVEQFGFPLNSSTYDESKWTFIEKDLKIRIDELSIKKPLDFRTVSNYFNSDNYRESYF
nr:hypothetical protein [uncultured Sphingobacterium sp.]